MSSNDPRAACRKLHSGQRPRDVPDCSQWSRRLLVKYQVYEAGRKECRVIMLETWRSVGIKRPRSTVGRNSRIPHAIVLSRPKAVPSCRDRALSPATSAYVLYIRYHSTWTAYPKEQCADTSELHNLC